MVRPAESIAETQFQRGRQLSAGQTLVVREDSSNNPGTYVLKGPGHVEQGGRSHPNRDQTRCSRACLLRKHGRFTRG